MKNSNQISTIGIDLSKNIFQIHAQDIRGKVVVRKKLNRSKLLEFIVNIPACTIAMEACGGAHNWARKIKALGHEVRIIAPKFVKPYVTGNKDDQADAAAIAEAATKPDMRFVAVKEELQQEMSMIHTVREQLVKQRTATRNSVRGMLAEYGIIYARGWSSLRKGIVDVLSEDSDRLPIVKSLITMRFQDLLRMDEEVDVCDLKIQQWCKEDMRCRNLLKIDGIGPITATAIVAHMGSPEVFKNGRHFAAYLGLVPKHVGTGGKTRMLGISKRGDSYIRKLLVHGARSVVSQSEERKDKLGKWLRSLVDRRGFNKTTVALANKNARLCWAMLKYGSLT